MKEFEIYNDVNYSNLPSDDECMLNAVQISKIVGEPASTIRTWAERHQNNLYIKKINGRFVYTQASVDQFKFIKILCREKNMTHEQIYDHISKKGFEYQKYDSGLINPEDPLGYEALASQIMLKNQNMLKEFMVEFVKYQEQREDSLIAKINNEVAITVDERLDEKLDNFKSDLLQAVVDQKELEFKQRDEILLDNLRKHMEENQKKFEEQQSKKSFWSRLFKR